MIDILDYKEEKDEINEDEVMYQITPKGIAAVCMLHSGLITDMNDPRFEGFWRMFSEDMERCGYIQPEDDLK